MLGTIFTQAARRSRTSIDASCCAAFVSGTVHNTSKGVVIRGLRTLELQPFEFGTLDFGTMMPHLLTNTKSGRFMFKVFFLIFIAVPIVEIAVLLQVGELIGGLNTLALIILTALV